MTGAVGCTVSSQDVRHFQPRPECGHHHRSGPWLRWRQKVERTCHLCDVVGADVGVSGSRLERVMPQQRLNDNQFGPAFQQVRGEAVPQRVRCEAPFQVNFLARSAECSSDGFRSDVSRPSPAGKQPVFRTVVFPVFNSFSDKDLKTFTACLVPHQRAYYTEART